MPLALRFNHAQPLQNFLCSVIKCDKLMTLDYGKPVFSIFSRFFTIRHVLRPQQSLTSRLVLLMSTEPWQFQCLGTELIV